MNTNDIVIAQFKRLLEEGHRILAAAGWDGRKYQRTFPGDVEYLKFRTSAMNLVRRACGETSDHYRQLRQIAEDKQHKDNSFYMHQCVGVVEAAHEDFSRGLLFDLKALVAAELLGDFLEQAEHLVAEGYYVPAASVAGAILEDALRELCQKHSIPVPIKTNIEMLNVALAKANIYDKLVQKQITAFADLRNNADHGHFTKVSATDVAEMVKWVHRFGSTYL
ncbi:MAG TPA: DUF4145 domain-containing protein [Acidobacteriota bacterium]